MPEWMEVDGYCARWKDNDHVWRQPRHRLPIALRAARRGKCRGACKAERPATIAAWDKLYSRKATIGTAAGSSLLRGESALARTRHPDVLADAACGVFSMPSSNRIGQMLADEGVLRQARAGSFAESQPRPEQPTET
jgi:hypothetical protein